jgi:hypothetical protein
MGFARSVNGKNAQAFVTARVDNLHGHSPCFAFAKPFRSREGKPPGTRHRITVLAEQLMADDAEGIVRMVIEAAKAGDMTAARLILDRIAPARKGCPVSFPLPTIETTADVKKALSAVAASMASGELTPEKATARVAKKLKLQERRAVIPSRRSFAACRPLGFFGAITGGKRVVCSRIFELHCRVRNICKLPRIMKQASRSRDHFMR